MAVFLHNHWHPSHHPWHPLHPPWHHPWHLSTDLSKRASSAIERLGPNFEGLRLELELERLGLGLERLRMDLEKLGVARSLLPHLINYGVARSLIGVARTSMRNAQPISKVPRHKHNNKTISIANKYYGYPLRAWTHYGHRPVAVPRRTVRRRRLIGSGSNPHRAGRPGVQIIRGSQPLLENTPWHFSITVILGGGSSHHRRSSAAQ